jgi:hypothetical protein
MIDLLLLAVIAAVTWCVASEGAWGSALTFLSVLIAGLLAMNWFESLAEFLQATVGSSPEMSMRWDVISLLGLFALFTFGLRTLTDQMMPTFVQVHPIAFNVSRWAFGVMTGYLTAAILLTALHVSPLPRNFWDFTPERNNLLDASAPDRQWLAYTQYVSESILRKGQFGPIFDGDQFSAIPNGTRETWSSFPMRYAMRRQNYETYTAAAAGAAPPPSGGQSPAGGQPLPQQPSLDPNGGPSAQELEGTF